MNKEIWEVDLRSRKTGNSIETIFSGEHDAACEFMDEWYKNNTIPGYVDGMRFEDLHDGSEGVFADLYATYTPHEIGKYQEETRVSFEELERKW